MGNAAGRGGFFSDRARPARPVPLSGVLSSPLYHGWHARPRGWACHPCTPTADPHRAAPGQVPYADYLRAIHETDRAGDRGDPGRSVGREPDRFEPSGRATPARTPEQSPGRASEPGASRGWATLGEVAPAEPAPEARVEVDRITRVMSPMGGMIDLTV